MRRHIENLKRQHPAVRTRVAFFAASSITAAIAFVWLTTLPLRFGGSEVSQDTTNTDGKTGTASVISAFGDLMSPGMQDIQKAFSGNGMGDTATPTEVPGIDVVNNPGQTGSASADANTTTDAPMTTVPNTTTSY